MAKLRIRYLTFRPRHNGTNRYYWQPDKALASAGWKMRRLSDNLAEAMTEAEGINQSVDQWRLNLIDRPANAAPGTVDAAIESYKASRRYKEKADRTRKDYDYYLDRISEWAGAEPAALISAKMVQDLYETNREKSSRKASYLIQVLRLLFSHAERESIIPIGTNPARRPGIDYKAKKGTLWKPEDVRHFVEVADALNMQAIGTAIMLNEWLGQRPSDLLKMTMGAYRNGALHIRQSKTGAEVALPIDMVPALKGRIEQQIEWNKKPTKRGKVSTVALIQQRSKNLYSYGGFKSSFDMIRAEAAKSCAAMKDLQMKNLRHTAVTRLAEAGCEIPMIAAVTGHTFRSCQEIIDRYNVRTTRMAQEAFRRRIESNLNQGVQG